MKIKLLIILIGSCISIQAVHAATLKDSVDKASESRRLTKAEKDAIAVKEVGVLTETSKNRPIKLAGYEQKRQEIAQKNQQEAEKYKKWKARKVQKDALIKQTTGR